MNDHVVFFSYFTALPFLKVCLQMGFISLKITGIQWIPNLANAQTPLTLKRIARLMGIWKPNQAQQGKIGWLEHLKIIWFQRGDLGGVEYGELLQPTNYRQMIATREENCCEHLPIFLPKRLLPKCIWGVGRNPQVSQVSVFPLNFRKENPGESLYLGCFTTISWNWCPAVC